MDGYKEQESCENCEFMETTYGNSGYPDTFFCDYGQDYKKFDKEGMAKSFDDKKYKQWKKAKEVRKCGICDNYKNLEESYNEELG